MFKSRKILLILVALCVIAGTGTVFTQKILAKDEKIQFSIHLNKEFSKRSNNTKMHENGLDKHLGIKSKELFPESFINATINLKDSKSTDFKLASGHGVVKMGNETFPLEIHEQPLPMYTLKDGKVVYRGGLTGSFKTKQDNSTFVLGIDHIPSTDETFVSTHIGVLNEQKGLAVLRFGTPIIPMEISNEIREIHAKQKKKNQESGEITQ